MFSIIKDDPDLEAFEFSEDKIYVRWPRYGINLSHYDIMEGVSGKNVFSPGTIAGKLSAESLGHNQRDEMNDAIGKARLAYLISKEKKDGDGIGINAGNLGMFHAKIGEREKAKEYLLTALQFGRSSQLRGLEANTVGNLGVILVEEGDIETGIIMLTASRDLHAADKNYLGQSISCGEIGIARFSIGAYDEALASFEEALEFAERANSEWLIEDWTGRVEFMKSPAFLEHVATSGNKASPAVGRSSPLPPQAGFFRILCRMIARLFHS